VLDTGKVEDNQVCPPQLLTISLITNKVVSQYKFPKSQYQKESLFITPVIDIRDFHNNPRMCMDTFVYIADVTGHAILVYDHRNKNSWVVRNNLFKPYPNRNHFTINNESFDLDDGILGLALGPVQPNHDRRLFFHSLASSTESYVSTSVLRNYTLSQDPTKYVSYGIQRSTQVAAQASTYRGVLFFGLIGQNTLACWNSYGYNYGDHNIEKVAVDRQRLQFLSGVKVVQSRGFGEEVWMLTSALQKFMTGSMTSNETNFWIVRGHVDDLTRGTKCMAHH